MYKCGCVLSNKLFESSLVINDISNLIDTDYVNKTIECKNCNTINNVYMDIIPLGLNSEEIKNRKLYVNKINLKNKANSNTNKILNITNIQNSNKTYKEDIDLNNKSMLNKKRCL